MRQIILRYGLVSGAIASVFMTATALFFHGSPDFENGHYYGYAGIFLSMIVVFVGVRAYREDVGQGQLSFSKGFQVGILIAIISCICYVLAWFVVYEALMPDFMDQYIAHALAQMQQSGAAQAEIEQFSKEMEAFKIMYQNPLYRFGMTFLEPFRVGLLVALGSALVLKKGNP